MAPNNGKGRKKIEIAKMQNKTNLHVTFSKRCSGLMKKANELCTLSGAEIGLIVFTPGNKPYSFGNPSVESIIHEYQTGARNPQALSTTERLDQLQRLSRLDKVRGDIADLQGEVEAEKERGVDLDQTLNNYWWEAPIESLNLEQVEKLMRALEVIQKEAKNDQVEQELQKIAFGLPIAKNYHIVNSGGHVPPFANNSMVSGYGFGVPLESAGPSAFGTSFQPVPRVESTRLEEVQTQVQNGFDHQVQQEIQKKPYDHPIMNNHMVNSSGHVPTFVNNSMVSGSGSDIAGPSGFGSSLQPIPQVESSGSNASAYLNPPGTGGFGGFGMY